MTQIKISLRETELLNTFGPDIFLAGNFNRWNSTEYRLDYDQSQLVYTAVIWVEEGLKSLVFKLYSCSKNQWFSLPESDLEIDCSNCDGNNVLHLDHLPFDNNAVFVSEISPKFAGEALHSDMGIPCCEETLSVVELDCDRDSAITTNQNEYSEMHVGNDNSAFPAADVNYIVLHDESIEDKHSLAENASSNFEVSTPTEVIKSESYTNILLSTSTNDMASLASSSNKRNVSDPIKLNLNTESSASKNQTQNLSKTKSHLGKTQQPSLKTMFKKVLGYK